MSELMPTLVGKAGDSLREAFGKKITKLAVDYPDVVVLDADIAGGTGAHHFRKAFPSRFYQFGISEQNMMSAAGGMASVGLVPVVTTFATFSLRAFEQARLSLAYTNRNVKIVASHPGLDTGPDGASAQALEDIAAFRAIPGMVVVSPADPVEMELATEAMLNYDGPMYMRSGRSPAKRLFKNDHSFVIGKGQILREGTHGTIIACGVEVARSLEAAEVLSKSGINVRVVNMPTIKPIDSKLIIKCAKETGAIVTAEDHNIFGGLGSAVSEVLVQNFPVVQEFVGVRDCFGESGEPEELAEKYGLCSSSIIAAVKKVVGRKNEKS